MRQTGGNDEITGQIKRYQRNKQRNDDARGNRGRGEGRGRGVHVHIVSQIVWPD